MSKDFIYVQNGILFSHEKCHLQGLSKTKTIKVSKVLQKEKWIPMSYFIKVKYTHSQETNMVTEGEWWVEVIN